MLMNRSLDSTSSFLTCSPCTFVSPEMPCLEPCKWVQCTNQHTIIISELQVGNINVFGCDELTTWHVRKSELRKIQHWLSGMTLPILSRIKREYYNQDLLLLHILCLYIMVIQFFPDRIFFSSRMAIGFALRSALWKIQLHSTD